MQKAQRRPQPSWILRNARVLSVRRATSAAKNVPRRRPAAGARRSSRGGARPSRSSRRRSRSARRAGGDDEIDLGAPGERLRVALGEAAGDDERCRRIARAGGGGGTGARRARRDPSRCSRGGRRRRPLPGVSRPSARRARARLRLPRSGSPCSRTARPRYAGRAAGPSVCGRVVSLTPLTSGTIIVCSGRDLRRRRERRLLGAYEGSPDRVRAEIPGPDPSASSRGATTSSSSPGRRRRARGLPASRGPTSS